jgi:sugar lactone lactonase YvrE
MKSEPFVRGLNFGEGLRWHEDRFWYSDFHQHRVSSAAPDGTTRVELEIDDRPSGLGWLPDGRLLVVAMLNQRVLRREKDGRAVLHADLKGLAKFHANDMLVDSRGNAFIGCFGFDLDAFIEKNGTAPLFAEPGPPTAPIMRVTPDGKASIGTMAGGSLDRVAQGRRLESVPSGERSKAVRPGMKHSATIGRHLCR